MAEDLEGPASLPLDDELTLPKSISHFGIISIQQTQKVKATMQKMIEEHMRSGMTFTPEARDLITQCCLEFIHLITTESNEVCEKAQKKTVLGDHLLTAIDNLGFSEYLKEMREELEEHAKQQKIDKSSRPKTNKLKDSGMTQEELIKMQQELFNTAKASQGMIPKDEQIENDVKIEKEEERIDALKN